MGGGRYAYLPLGQRALTQLAASIAAPDSSRQFTHLELPPLADSGELAALARSLAGSDVQSYRQMPVRGAGRGVLRRERSQGRGGPLNAREAPGLFMVAMDGSEEAAQAAYRAHRHALCALFARCGLSVITAGDPTAAVQGHAYLHLSGDAADSALMCDGCGYAALAGVAGLSRPPVEPETALPLEKIATPHTSTIADLAQLLGVSESRTAKAVFLMASAEEGEQFVFAVVRGDMDVSERKLRGPVARQRAAGHLSTSRNRGRNPGHRRHAGLCVANRAEERDRRSRRTHRAVAEPGGRRERRGLPPAEHELRPRLQPRAWWPTLRQRVRAMAVRAAAAACVPRRWRSWPSPSAYLSKKARRYSSTRPAGRSRC